MKAIHALSGAGILLLASPLLCAPLLYAQSPEPNFDLPPGSPASAVPITMDDAKPWTPDEDYLSGPQSDCEPVRLYSSRFAAELTLADFELDDGSARYWTTKPTGVTRVEFSIENDEGFGLRAMLWSLDTEGKLGTGSLDVRVATYYLDG